MLEQSLKKNYKIWILKGFSTWKSTEKKHEIECVFLYTQNGERKILLLLIFSLVRSHAMEMQSEKWFLYGKFNVFVLMQTCCNKLINIFKIKENDKKINISYQNAS